MVNLVAVRGDTNIYTVPVRKQQMDDGGEPTTDPDGAPLYDPVDLAGASMWFTAKRNRYDNDDQAVIRNGFGPEVGALTGINFIAPTSAGNAEVTIDPVDLASMPDDYVNLYYDIQVKESSGTITTIVRGNLLVVPDRTES